MPIIRAIVVISALAAAAWLVPGALHAVIVWFGPPPADGPGPLALLLPLLPETVPVWAWHSVAPWPVLLVAASALALASVTAAGSAIGLARMPADAQRWRVAVTLWLITAAAGVVTFGAQAIGSLVDEIPFLRLQSVAEQGGAALVSGLLWGAVWGWIPGVVASRAGVTPRALRESPGPRPRSLVAVAVALAVLTTGAVVATRPAATDANYAATGQYTVNGVQPAPPQPSDAPTPPPSVSPDAVAADPSWCGSTQLAFADGGGDAATGHRLGAIRARNIGDTPCTLSGYPDLAFADDAGNAVAVTVVPGGGFMAEDPGSAAIELAPGDTAVTYATWDATDGRSTLSAVYVAPYGGAERVVLTVANPWDLTAETVLAVTAWQAG